MSTLSTNTIIPVTGTTVTLGESGDTISLASGASATGFNGVLQSLQDIKTDIYTSTAQTWTDVPDLDITITPTTSGNKLWISSVVHASNATGNNHFAFRITIDGTAYAIGDAGGSNRARATGAGNQGSVSDGVENIAMQYLYTTSSTSAHVVKIQHIVGNATLQVNRTEGDNNDNIYYSRQASTLTVMEIGA